MNSHNANVNLLQNGLRRAVSILLALVFGICIVTAVTTSSFAAYADEAAETPVVVFQYDSGKKVTVASGETIALNNLDQGHFALEGVSYAANWIARERVDYDDGTYENRSFINKYSGVFQPSKVTGKRAVSVTNEATGSQVYSFYLENTPCHVDDLKLYVDGAEVSEVAPCVASGADTKFIEAKGRITGTNDYVTVPINRLEYHTTESIFEDKVDRYDASFWVPNDETITFIVSLMDNPDVEARFLATSKHIPVTGLSVRVPKTWVIHAWNGIFGEQFVGINEGSQDDRYSVSIEPYNASVRKVVWEALTPEIAEFVELHGCGIVPKKNGLAKFRVHSAENNDIYDDVEVNFVYKEPLTKATVVTDELSMTVNSTKELAIATVPHNASEQRFNWTYSEPDIVTVKDEISNDPSSVLIEKTTAHYISAKKEGCVTVTGTPYDQSAGAEPVVFTVTVKPNGTSDQTANVAQLTNEGIKHGTSYLSQDSVGKNAYLKEWNVFVLSRAGVGISSNDKASYLASLKEKVSSLKKPTDIARVTLALTSLGEDPRKFGGVNLIEKLYNAENLEQLPSNMVVWTLIGLDSHAYEIPWKAKYSRDDLIKLILKFQNANGGFGLGDNKSASIDMTGMSLQALAPYYNSDHKDVVAAVDAAISYLKETMTDNAGYVEGGSENSCTVAQVITALSALNINCADKANGFTFGKKNLITNICSFETTPYGFKTYAKDGSTDVNEMSTQQSTYALVAYQRYLNGNTALYDLTDVKFQNESTGESAGSDGSSDDDGKKDEGMGAQTVPASKPGNQNGSSAASGATVAANFAKSKVKITGAKSLSSTKAKLSWNAIPGAQGYTIYRASKKSGPYRIVGAVTKAGVRSFADKGLKSGGTYYYRVRAYTVIGGQLKETKAGKAVKVALKPGKVKFVSAKATGSGKAKLKWKKTRGAKGYVVSCKAAGSKSYSLVKTIKKASKTSLIVKSLKSGKKYSYKVRAFRVIDGKKVYGKWSKVKKVAA